MKTYREAGDVFRSIERGIRDTGEFTVTDQHLALLRVAYVSWDDCEFGAPAIDCKRPYGNSLVERDIATILNEPEWQTVLAEDDRHEDEAGQEFYLSRNRDRLVRLHAETGVALQIALATGRFAAGQYRLKSNYDDTSWERVDTNAWPPA